MITSIALGFVFIFLLSYWFGARVASKRQSVGLGFTTGLVSYVVMLGLYPIALATWARARLMSFLNTELPMLVEKVMGLVGRFTLIRETI